ncbi:hypothetical protein TSUD_373810 [Trifolium subterraneum]|uniref:Uncharacterized protein n=1 Tax=Trifolium subterraneum TaxID=3900 RepID=A0A2Z6M729_TRISU|nr:hypothetical protein TSUD_373810 [Trifolium subterraneum]
MCNHSFNQQKLPVAGAFQRGRKLHRWPSRFREGEESYSVLSRKREREREKASPSPAVRHAIVRVEEEDEGVCVVVGFNELRRVDGRHDNKIYRCGTRPNPIRFDEKNSS